MFKFVSETTGEIIGYAENPIWIKWHEENQCYVATNRRRAQGVAIDSVAYNLFPRHEFEEQDSVIAIEIDGGDNIFANESKNSANAGFIAMLEDAVCEQDVLNDERLSAIEDAICELDELINGGNNNE